MRTKVENKTAWSHIAISLALIALMLRVLVPPGFMIPNQADQRGFAIVLCTAQGAQTIELDQDAPSKDAPAPTRNDKHPCAFSAPAQALTPPQVAAIVAVVWASAPRPAIATMAAAPGRGLAAPPPPQTGPPLLI